ncbi:MAG: hypothetical protein CL424_03020 [Acidimicrobiaceae bacterium]|nr:hypothetical protein [Acidimicrobiaceae bacterium]
MSVVTAATVAASALVGCGGDGANEMHVDRPRVGATPIGADAALYFEITAPDDDRLVAVDTDVAQRTSLHVTGSVDGTMLDTDAFELPAGTPVRLEPFGDHVMLEQVGRELQPGDEVTLTLRFGEHDPMTITADVSQLYELAWEDS